MSKRFIQYQTIKLFKAQYIRQVQIKCSLKINDTNEVLKMIEINFFNSSENQAS